MIITIKELKNKVCRRSSRIAEELNYDPGYGKERRENCILW